MNVYVDRRHTFSKRNKIISYTLGQRESTSLRPNMTKEDIASQNTDKGGYNKYITDEKQTDINNTNNNNNYKRKVKFIDEIDHSRKLADVVYVESYKEYYQDECIIEGEELMKACDCNTCLII